MSGGSFEYLYCKVENHDLYGAVSAGNDMFEFLMANGRTAEAAHVRTFVNEVQRHIMELAALGEKYEMFLKAIEWWVSCDVDYSLVEARLQELETSIS